MTDIEAIRARHKDCTARTCLYYPEFYDAHLDTPCDTAVVLAALEDRILERDHEEMVASLRQSERDAARADADRLAEALRSFMDALDGKDGSHTFHMDPAREALRQHEETTR